MFSKVTLQRMAFRTMLVVMHSVTFHMNVTYKTSFIFPSEIQVGNVIIMCPKT